MIDVKKVAHLSRLKISETEEKAYHEQMTDIFKYFEEIATIDTKGIEPMVTPSEIEFVFRKDEAHFAKSSEEALANAPEKSGHLFKVPPVV